MWSNKGAGARDELSLWAPEVETSYAKKSKVKVSLGHYAASGYEEPGKGARMPPAIIEVSDTGAGMMSNSEHLAAVIEQLLPTPLRFRLVWHAPVTSAQGGATVQLHVWRAVPPGPQFAAVGMVATTSEEPPPLTALRCVPRRWLVKENYAATMMWSNEGEGGRAGSFWTSGTQLQTLLAVQGHEAPADELRWRVHSERFFAEPEKLKDIIELLRPGERKPSVSQGGDSGGLFGRGRKESKAASPPPGPGGGDSVDWLSSKLGDRPWDQTPEGQAASAGRRAYVAATPFDAPNAPRPSPSPAAARRRATSSPSHRAPAARRRRRASGPSRSSRACLPPPPRRRPPPRSRPAPATRSTSSAPSAARPTGRPARRPACRTRR